MMTNMMMNMRNHQKYHCQKVNIEYVVVLCGRQDGTGCVAQAISFESHLATTAIIFNL